MWREYLNIRKILELLNLKDLKFKVCADLKIVNIILGLSGHGGKYSCAFCYGECTLAAGPVRTFRHLKEQYNMYLEAGSPVKKMQQFYNVVLAITLQRNSHSSELRCAKVVCDISYD